MTNHCIRKSEQEAKDRVTIKPGMLSLLEILEWKLLICFMDDFKSCLL